MLEIKSSPASGYGLLELLVAVGISGLLLIGLSNVTLSVMKSRKHMEAKDDRFSVMQAIQFTADCQAASYPLTCVPGQLVSIPNKKGGILINQAGTSTMRGWTLRATCRALNRVEVSAAKLKPDGSFLLDPLTKKPYNWQHRDAIIIPAGTLCPTTEVEPPITKNPKGLKLVFGLTCYITDGTVNAQCSDPAVEPPPCPANYESLGVGQDDFGSTDAPPVNGYRKIRYCVVP